MLRACKKIVLAAFLMIGFSAITFGQAGSATVSGKVTDPNGLVVVGANIEATNIETNVSYPAVTNDAGFYSLSSLHPGKYSLTVQKIGFKSIVKPNIDFHVADDISVNFELQIGAISQTVTVAGGAPLVNTTNSSLGGLVQADEVASLPLNGRNYELVITRYSWMPSSPSVLPEKLAVEPPFASPGSVVGSALRYIRARCNPRLQ